MKKIMTIITALAFGASAFAKTSAEMVVEYNTLTATPTASLFQAQLAYADANASDLITAFNEWKTTPNAKLREDELMASIKDNTQLNTAITLRRMFAKLYDNNYDKLEASDLILCELGSGAVKYKFRPSWYEIIKNNNWVVDGKTLAIGNRYFLAKTFGDEAYIASLTMADAQKLSSNGFTYWVMRRMVVLLDMSDAEAAKAECRNIENYLIAKKELESSALKQVQAVSKALTSRLIDTKILGK